MDKAAFKRYGDETVEVSKQLFKGWLVLNWGGKIILAINQDVEETKLRVTLELTSKGNVWMLWIKVILERDHGNER